MSQNIVSRTIRCPELKDVDSLYELLIWEELHFTDWHPQLSKLGQWN